MERKFRAGMECCDLRFFPGFCPGFFPGWHRTTFLAKAQHEINPETTGDLPSLGFEGEKEQRYGSKCRVFRRCFRRDQETAITKEEVRDI